MSRVCQITGKRPMVGHKVSHSNIKTKRRFYPNLVSRRFYIPEERRWVKLRISTSGLRVINKRGIYACILDMRKRGIKI